MQKEENIYYASLGGVGEIGMNIYLYGFGNNKKKDWIIVDMGITFGDDMSLGVDLIVPDPSFIAQRKEDLKAIFITHAHEDHVGSIPMLIEIFPKVPIYATKLAKEVIKGKLHQSGIYDVDIRVMDFEVTYPVGKFKVEPISLNHSIPEMAALLIKTPKGNLFHTGDWKFDPNPVIGRATDYKRLEEIGEQGIIALVGDSTGVMSKGHSGSEGELEDGFIKIFQNAPKAVFVACFASNVGRLLTVARAAKKSNRKVAMMGRSMHRFLEAAKASGYMGDMPALIPESEANNHQREELVILLTGSQGEPRAAMARIAAGKMPFIQAKPEDTVVFSSRVIPGNELAINRVRNALAKSGVNIVTSDDEKIHVSGHAYADEFRLLYKLLRPKTVVPVHGAYIHMVNHAKLALSCGVKRAPITSVGELYKIMPNGLDFVEKIDSGKFSWEGNRLVPIESHVVRDRVKVLYQGAVFITLVLNKKNLLTLTPKLTTVGLIDEELEDDFYYDAIFEVEKRVKEILAKNGINDDIITNEVGVVLKRFFHKIVSKKPKVTVHIIKNK